MGKETRKEKTESTSTYKMGITTLLLAVRQTYGVLEKWLSHASGRSGDCLMSALRI
jgi:hypothetical protein